MTNDEHSTQAFLIFGTFFLISLFGFILFRYMKTLYDDYNEDLERQNSIDYDHDLWSFYVHRRASVRTLPEYRYFDMTQPTHQTSKLHLRRVSVPRILIIRIK
jgi:hypothetical protein